MPNISEIVNFLEDKDSINIGESPWFNEDLTEYDIYNLDWKKLFEEDNGWDIPMYEPELEGLLGLIRDSEEGADSKKTEEINSDTCKDDWDVCAWYQPIHFHGYDWGIFIKEDCIFNFAKKIAPFVRSSPKSFSPTLPYSNLIKSIIRASFALHYLHELYHHKTECLGIRLHVVEGSSRYLPYMNRVYKPAIRTDNNLEETIANAYMYRRLKVYKKWITEPVIKAALTYLDRSFPFNPPSYRLAPKFLEDNSFGEREKLLMSRVQEFTQKPSKKITEWEMAPRINQSFFNLRSDIWFIVPKGKKCIIPSTSVPLSTCSSIEMIKICEKSGYKIVKGGKGSHVKLKKPGHPTLIIPSNKPNLSPCVARNVLDALGAFKISDIPTLL